MNYNSNIVSVTCNGATSTGYAFKSTCDKNFVITSKHSVCSDKATCHLLINCADNPCRKCTAKLINSNVSIQNNDIKIDLTAIHISDQSDVAIIEINNVLSGVQYLTCEPNTEHRYEVWKHDGQRILLNTFKDIGDGYSLFNIESNITAELQAKKNVMPGFSGSPIFTEGKIKPICHAIITDNEKLNNIGAEILSKKLMSELSAKTGTILDKSFSELSDQVDKIFFSDNFFEIIKVKLENDIDLNVYSSAFNNEFFLRAIAEYLVKNLTRNILPPKDTEKKPQGDLTLIKVIGKFLKEPSDKYSKSSLLQSIIESDLLAPALYRSVDDNDFNSIHLKETFPNKFEFILTRYHSDESLIESISKGIDSIKRNKRSLLPTNILLSEGILHQSVSTEQAIILSEILRPDSNKNIDFNYALLSTFVPELDKCIYTEKDQGSKFDLLKTNIRKIVEHNITSINAIFSDKTLWGASYYVYLIPINHKGELREIMNNIITELMD
ncbi:hypothetical protein [Aeromonas veronii]|uniref:hypothetical protein n=1 Tax=Aeromonas veronii TaxID=654 RepID=UPI00191D1CA0|nr:hypothetical protein [Aeromonas veronii]MBL0492299.1 hypothetical protein [Aeromonas veronii]